MVGNDECCQASTGNDNLALACPADLAGLDEPCETYNQGLNANNPDCESPLVCQLFDPANPYGDKYCVDPSNFDTTEARVAELLQTGAFSNASIAAYWVGADINNDDTIDQSEVIAFYQ